MYVILHDIGIEYKYNDINILNVYYGFIRLWVRQTVNVLSNNFHEFFLFSSFYGIFNLIGYGLQML